MWQVTSGQFIICRQATCSQAAYIAPKISYMAASSCRRKVTISKFTGKPTVNIREYYEVRGSPVHSYRCKALALSLQWYSFVDPYQA